MRFFYTLPFQDKRDRKTTISKSVFCLFTFLFLFQFESKSQVSKYNGIENSVNKNEKVPLFDVDNSRKDELKEQVKRTLKENAQTLQFLENKGQFPNNKVLYYFESENGSAYIEKGLIRFLANEYDSDNKKLKAAHSFSLKFDNANSEAQIDLGESFSTNYNYFLNGSVKGISGVKAAKDLTFKNLYPGIDLRLYSSKDGTLEFDWIVSPGADYRNIKMNFEGQDNISILRDGSLKVGLRFTDIKFHIPESYQVTEIGKRAVDFEFESTNGHIISFKTNDEIDQSLPLVIDPILNWGTLFDGNNSAFDQYLYAIQVDSVTGYIYCAGSTNRQIPTNSAPYTANGYLNTVSGLSGSQTVAVVYSINSTGTALIDMTLFGPSSVASGDFVEAYALSLSPNNVFIGGYTDIAIPMTGSSFDNTLDGTADGYIAVFSKDLGTLNYSTYLGGSGNDNRGVTSIRAISDNSFVVGMTAAAALPTSSPNYISSGVVQSTFSGTRDFYIAKFSSYNTLTWGTYIGTSALATFNDLEILNNNTIAFCGYGTGSLTSTEVNGISTGSTGSDEDGIIGVLNSTATAFNFLDKIGASSGSNTNDRINDIEIVGDTLYFTGSGGNNFPVSGSGVYSSTYYGGTSDVIVGKCFRGGGSGSYKATFYGTSGADLGNGIRLVSSIGCNTDPITYIMVFGTVNGSGLPTVNINSESFYNSSRPGGIDIFYSGFNSQLNTLAYGTYIGGSGNDYLGATGDPRGANHLWVNGVNVYVGTTIHSNSFTPNLLVNGFDLTRSAGSNDAHIIFSIQFASLLQSDYGDAPASYGTPSHIISCNNLKIGNLDDNEAASIPTTYANGDDNSNLDDEDGISSIPTIYNSTSSYSLTVNNILNTTGSNATLYGWVDFNGDGAFQTNEMTSTTVATGSNNVSKTLTWSGITVSGSASSRYIRIRLTTDNLLDDAGTASVDERSTVSASNGEVEDYIAVGLNCPTSQTENPCQSQSTINSKFATWLATVSAGGCVSGGTLSNNSGSAPSVITGGTATVTFTYTNSCSTASCSSTFTVTAPSTISLTNSKTDVLCYGNSTGAIDLSVSGGTAPYTYLWSNGATTQDLTSLTAGTYSVTVTDANGCTGSTNVTITQPAALSVSISSQTNVACYGGSTGSLTMSGAGGTSPYQYKYDGGSYQSSPTFTGLSAVSNIVTIKDANNCLATINTTITQPSAALTASISSQTNVLCFGNSTGSVTVIGANGTSPYQYKLDAGAYQVSGTFSSLAAGSYTVTVKDANNCTTTQAVTITQTSTALGASISSQTNVLCFGNSTGAVTVAGTGGTTAYQYKLDAGAYQASGTFTGLVAGPYTVTVKDANNCTTTQAVTITQPSAALSSTISAQTNISCFGGTEGSVTVTGVNGTSPYQYKIGSGSYQASGTFSTLTFGNYTVTVKDANNCTTTQAVTITQPSAALSPSISSQTNVACYGNATGSVTVNATGGTGIYTFKIGSGSYQASGTFSGLTAGSYTITVKDANNCTATQAVTITGPSSGLSASISSQTNVACYGNSTGAVTVAGTGGTSSYQYKLDAGSYQVSGTFTGLAAGSYTVTIKDANNCTTTQAVTITQPSAALSSTISSQTNISCFGGTEGSVTVVGLNGTSPYQYKIGSGSYQLSGTFSTLSAGSYTVTVKDANNCTTTQAVTITGPSSGLSASISSQTNVACYGNSTGAVTIVGSGGTTSYQYKLDAGSYQGSGTFTGLSAGSYTVTVRDANNCTTTQAVTITGPSSGLSTSISSQTNVACYGNSTGAVTVVGSGGTASYQYKLDAGSYQVSGTFTGLTAGSYIVTVKDANNCTTTQAVTITQPSAALSSTISSQTNISCFGGTEGSVTVVGLNGTSPYQYKIGSGSYQLSGTFSTLSAGSYTVTVKDANNCTTTQAVTITGPSSGLSASISSQTNVACYGNSTGAVTVVGSGGTASYQYKLDAGSYQVSGTFSGLAAGSYTVTIKDANNCTTTQVVTITGPSSGLSASISSQTNVACYGNSTGEVIVTGSGGTTSYQYKLDAGSYQGSGTFSGLAAGSYTVTVKDANNCTTTQAITITGPSSGLSASISSQSNVSCYGGNNGAVSVLGTSGTPSYEYKLGSGSYQLSGTFSSLSSGSYTITVKDANNCTTTQSVNITQPILPLTSSIIAQTNITCFSTPSGSVTVEGTNGTPGYQYKLDAGSYQVSGTFSGLSAGSYTVTIKDANNCTTTQAVTITGPTSAISSSVISQTNVLCFGAATGQVTVEGSGGTGPIYAYKLGSGIFQASGTYSGLAAGNYTITIQDQYNCTTTQSVTITQPASAVSTSISAQTNVSCFGLSNGSVTVTATGGTPTYLYKLNNGSYQASGTFGSLSPGTYSITVKDANDCIATQIVTITQPNAIFSATCSNVNATAYGVANGSASVSVSGGTAPYSYLWSNGATTSTATGLLSGTYSVAVTDANGCAASCITSMNNFPEANFDSITVAEDASIATNVSSNDILSADGGNNYSISCSLCSTTTHGTLTFNSNGTFTYVPNPNFNGIDQFIYTLCDGGGDCDTALVTINVTPVDDLPSANWDGFSTNEDTPFSGSVASNDAPSGDGGNVWSLVTPPSHGSVSVNSNGSIIYTPTSNYNGPDQFIYQLCDVDGDCDTALVVLTVVSVDDLPIANWDAATTNEDVPLNGSLTSNDSPSGDGGNLWNLVSNPTHGSVIVNANGTYTYTPDANYNGTDQFVYQLCDADGDCDSAIVYLTINPVNDAPIAVWDSKSTGVNNSVSGSVSGNDSDIDNNLNPTGFTLTSGPAHGSITFNNNGTYTYTPNSNYNGTDEFVYQVCDLGMPVLCDTAVVYLSIANNPPVANVDFNSTSNDAPVSSTVASNDTDPDGNINANSYTLICATCTNVSNGTLVFNINGSYTYTPNSGFAGTDYFVYQVCDNGSPALCDTAVVYITQIGSNIISQTNQNCYNDAIGSVTVLGTGGTAPYQYKIGSGSYQSSGTFSGLAAGTHTITVKDANNYTTTQSVTITQPTILASSIASQSNVDCYGSATGAVTVAGSGGTAPYQYKLGSGAYQGSGSFSGLAVGTHTITVKDANNCTTTQSVTITQPSAALNATISSQTNVTCTGLSSGSATVAAIGGTAPYQYKIGSGSYQSSTVFTGLTAGTYTVTVKDNNNCLTTVPVTISGPSSPLVGTITYQKNVSCNSASNGVVTVAASGGYGPIYSFKLGSGNFQASGTFNGLSAGSYVITVQDGGGCTSTVNVTISEPTALISSIASQTNILCYGATTGSVTASGSGGISPYTYRIDYSAYQSSPTFNNLAAGGYVITVKDANDCIDKVNVTITQPSAPLIASVSSQTNISCFGNADGSLVLSASNGTPSYSYSINGITFQASNTFSGLAVGSYNFTIKDANNCITTTSATITQPQSALGYTLLSQSNVTCFGGSNGSLNVTGFGGTAPYQYKLDFGAYQSSGSFNGLNAGTYNISIKDATNCTITFPITISQPINPLSSSITYQKNVSCYGDATGIVTVVGSGGTGPIYTYKMDNGNFQSSGTFNGLSSGAHVVTVKDANNCTTTQAVNITQPAAPLFAAIVSQTNVLCYGGATGEVTVTGTGGTAPYTYQINYSGFQSSGTFSNLTAGSYMITVKDANNCILKYEVHITQPSAPLALTTSSISNVSCLGGTNGSVVLAATGGTTPYQYKLGSGSYQVSNSFNTLSAGNYLFTVKDANNCISMYSVTISQPALPFTVACSVTNPTFSGATNGQIGVTTTNGVAPFTYLWNNSSTSNPLTGLSTGTYSVTVTDNIGCTATCSSTLNNYPVANYETYNLPVNMGVSGSVVGNVSDIDGNSNLNSFTLVSNASNGTLIFNSNGGFSYTPNLNYAGTDFFTYQVCDLGSPVLCDTSVVYFNVIGSPVTPSVSISTSSTTVCSGTSLTFVATPTNGGASPSYQWKINGTNAGTNSSSFTNANWTNNDVVTCVMTSNHPLALPVTATSNSITLTVTTSPSQPGSFTSYSNTLYWGQTGATYTVPFTSGVTYNWSYSGTGITINGSGNSVTLDVAQSATSGNLSVYASDGSCISPAQTIAITVQPYITWTCGGSNTNWNNAANWNAGFVPYSTINVLIPSSASCQPNLASSNCVRDLTVQTNATITIAPASTLCVNGNFNNNGSICQGRVILQGSSAQLISGNGTVCNFELNNGSGATINSGDTLKITETYLPTNGVLVTNGGLALISTKDGTATVLEHPGSCSNYISGDVIVQRFIAGGRRAFRFFGHPFSTSIGLDQLTDDIDITGDGGSTNGFTNTATNNPSSFWYNTLTGNGSAVNDNTGWIPFTHTNGSGVNSWDPLEGARILIRGQKGEGLTTCAFCVPSAVTIDMKAPINQCQVTNLLLPNSNCGFNFIGNPYPSNIDLSLTTRGSNVGANFTVWDPHQGVRGAYVDYPFAFSYILPAYSAFFTTTTANTNNEIVFDESNKVNASPTDNLFKTTSSTFGNNVVQLRILSNNDSLSWDRLLLFFNPAATVDSERLDKQKMSNPNLDFYTVTPTNKHLSIDVRPFVDGQVIPLGLNTDSLTDFKIRVDDYDVPAGAQVYLHDKFANVLQPMSLGYTYSFNINSNPLTQGDRFELFVSKSSSVEDLVNNPQISVAPNPVVDEFTIWTNAAISNDAHLEIRNANAQIVMSRKLNQSEQSGIKVNAKDWAAGVYFIVINNNGKLISEKVIKK